MSASQYNIARRCIFVHGPLSVLLLGLGSLLTSCVHSLESGVEVARAPLEDKAYQPVLERSTKDRTVFANFETRYQLTATYLSPEFRHAFGKRYEDVYHTAPGEFQEADSKSGFFVSIQAPVEERTDLSNPAHWTILLKTGETPLKPSIVKRLSDKERWRAFFPAINDWTVEYLVVFDAPSVNPNSPDLVVKTPITLTFANADAKVDLTW